MYTYNRASGSLATVPQSGSGELVATGTPATLNDGCVGPLPGALAGKIALIRRGTCGFYNKAINAQHAGAIGVVLYNNVAERSADRRADPSRCGARHDSGRGDYRGDGASIFGGLAANHTLTWTDQVLETPLATAGWCPTSARSARTPNSASSRTSAGPAVRSTRRGRTSSSAATTRSAHVDGSPARRRSGGADPAGEDKKISPAMVRTLLMNTALPKAVNIAPTSGLLEPRAAGAGLAQIVTQSRRLPGHSGKISP